MKRKGSNIITDEDITLTSYENQDKTLSEALSEQKQEIEQLKSNVKFIYKYGGIGSGSGSGGGGGSSTSWKVTITRLDTGAAIVSGTTINLSGTGTYGFSVQIFGGGTSTFRVTYNWVNSKGSQTRNEIVSVNEGFNSRQSLFLDKNGTLSITILNQDTQEPVVYNIPYITTSYTFELFYVYKDTKSRFTPSNNNIYMAEVKDYGLMAALSYSLAVNISKATYSYVDWDGVKHTINSDDPDISPEQKIEGKTTKIIYLDLCSNIIDFLNDNRNARYIQFPLDIDLILEGSTEKENIGTLYLKDNLIPSDIYLKVTTSAGSLYDNKQSEYPESGKFNLGSSVFQLTPYYGPLSVGRPYRLTIKLNGEPIQTDITELSDQVTQSVSVPITESGEQIIQFKIVHGSDSYTADYYICVREPSSSFSWYPENSIPPIVFSSYYRRFHESNISSLGQNETISMTINSAKKSYNLTSASPTTFDNYDQMLCLGFQYSEVNNLEIPIVSFNTANNGRGSIFVYQDRIIVSSSDTNTDPLNIVGDTREIFLPMTSKLSDSPSNYSNYHLLSIYKRFEFKDGNNYFRSIYIYLDGVLEGVFDVMTAEHKQYKSVSFYPGNYYVNLIESSSFLHTADTPLLNYTWLEDNDMVGYNYSYREKLLNLNVEEYEKVLYNNFKTFTRDSENYIHTNDTAIENIAINSKIPTLVINFTDNGGEGIGSYTGYGVDNFKRWMEVSHGENDEIDSPTITVQWSKGNGARLNSVLYGQNPAQFRITMQGSSTLGYRCKNWELIAPEDKKDGHRYIYSPNFIPVTENMSDEAKEEAYNSFLPEESFTLKADVVDSSHTNNNAMGSFINKVTTHFIDAQQPGSAYNGYIKNCLTGFPVLIFLHTKFKSGPEVQEADNNNFYFLGIYNFNLGRKSYFNLGYKNTSVLQELRLENGFKIYEISDEDNTLLSGIRVGEIQGNNEYFDFSQYDQTILFDIGNNDKTYMFGDFVDGTPGAANVKNDIREFVRKIALGGGYVFKEVGKTFSNTVDDNYGYDDKYSAIDQNGVPKSQVPNYRYQALRTKEGSQNKYTYTQIPEEARQSDLKNLILQDEEQQDLKPALDYRSLCEYYTTCMAFGLVDSVQKNLNIKSWDGGRSFHIAFYDMDTCLGVSNAGSKINYFAFSDYWKSEIGEDNRLNSTTVYRDFSPVETGAVSSNGESTSSFFDVPSSYLFAIAKYAYSILPDEKDLIMHPSNIWAKWRRRGNQISGDPQEGCLSNADYFMETFYNHHLDNVPVSAFNYNYRYKYFVVDQENHKYDDTNFPKFYGRKQAYTRDWVNGRLHILDAYFNINGISDRMGNYTAPTASTEYVDKKNTDIYVLKDIFSSTNSQGNQYSNLNYDVTVKARPYAPLIVDGTNKSYRYIFPEVSKNCIINLASSGTQYVLFGGSSLWTELSTINPFITLTGTLTINSDYFTNLTGNAGVCSHWSINTPSLKTISLINNTGFTGKLDFTSPDDVNKFPNLREVIINNTGLQLIVNKSTLTTVSALNMRSSSALNITNVPTLTSLAVSGSMSSLTIPAWKSGIVLPTTYSSANTSAYLNCSVININNDPTKYPNNTLKIVNNDTLSELTFSGFEEVVIENCPKLSIIKISDDSTRYLKKLSVIMPASSSIIDPPTTFTVGSVEGVVDLSGETELDTIVLKRCLMETVKLPNKEVNLNTEAFRYCSNLKYLHGLGTYNIKGTYIFADCPLFTMRQENSGEYSNIFVPSTTTSLNGEFYITDTNKKGSITIDAAIHFLNTSCLNASNVESIVYLFENQNIVYSKDDFIREYDQGNSSLKLSNFPRCKDVSRAFYNNPIDAYNRYMFSGLSSEVTDIKFSEVIGEDTRNHPSTNGAYETYGNIKYHVVYTTIDFLAEIIDKIKTLALRNYETDGIYYCFLDKNNSYTPLDKVNLEEIFNPEEKYPERLSSFTKFEIFPQHEINFKNWFNEHWRSISISTVFYYGSYPNVTQGSLDGLLQPLTLLYLNLFLSNITNYKNSTNGRVNMREFLNWDDINQVENLFFSSDGYKSLGFEKYVDYNDFHYIWKKILESKSLTSIASLFERCLIIDTTPASSNIPFTLIDNSYTGGVNNRIKHLGWMFKGCRTTNSLLSNEYRYWDINHDFFKYLPELTWVGYNFDNTLWKHAIPFDFFNKRQERTWDVYVEYEGEKVPAILHDYSYNRSITNFVRCFADIKLETASSFDPDAAYNNGSVKKAYIKRVVDGEEVGDEYSEYYTTINSTDPIILDQPSEIQDIEFARTADIDYINTTKLRGGDNDVYNYTVGDYSGLFVAPDIFYGASESVGSINSCFAASNISRNNNVFTGIIPGNLLRNCMNWQPSNVLANLNILPFKFAKYNDGNTTISCYKFVPSNYTGYQTLDNAFNFRLLVPKAKSSDLDVNETRYFILTSDSIPQNTLSLDYAFPYSGSTDSIFGEVAGNPIYYASDRGLRLNVMGTPVAAMDFNELVTYTPGIYVVYEGQAYEFIAQHTGDWNPDHVVEVDLPGNYYNVLPGLNIKILNKLKLDNIFNPDIMALTYGHMFTYDEITWSLSMLDSITNYCARVGYGGSSVGGVSFNLQSKWPSNNNNFIARSGECSVNKYCITNFNELDTSKYPSINFI